MNGGRYPVWQSLARDYLAVMASSVSSERAFSSAGITISKRRNRLDADIVEALQCLKSLLHQDLMVRDAMTITEEEAELDHADEQVANQDQTATEVVAWGDYLSDVGLSDNGGDDIGDVETEVDMSGSQP
jgi:hypothetical protein